MWPFARQIRYHNLHLVSFATIHQAVIEPLLIPEHGDSPSPGYCSECISDNDFGSSYYNVQCGQVATRQTIYANPPSVSATTTSLSSTIGSTSSSTTLSTESLSLQTSSQPSASSTSQTLSTTPPLTTSEVILTSESPSPLPVSSVQSDAQTSATAERSVPLGAIIGGALGGISVVCLTVLAVFLIRHRKRRASSVHSSSPLQRSPSCNKQDIREEPLEAYELVTKPTQYYEASDLNREAVEMQ
jgi:hypothetical protein